MFSNLLEGVSITVKSQDGKITCELSGGNRLAIEFAPGSYRRYSEGDLEHQLSHLLSALWVAHDRENFEALRRATGREFITGKSRLSGRRLEFAEARDRLQSRGVSRSGDIAINVTGAHRWIVKLKPGVVRRLTEEEFLYELWTAFVAADRDRRRNLVLFKREFYGSNAMIVERTSRR